MFFSRLNLAVSDLPDALGAEVTGYVESDFFGPNDDAVSTFRLRRAFVDLTWDNRSVLFGQEWSPLFTLAAFPQTIATTTGAPFQPFARHPQIRFTYAPGRLQFTGVAAWQRDAFADIPFDGTPGFQQQQRAALPGWHGHVQYHAGDRAMVGGGAHLKALQPEVTGDRFYTGAVQGYGTVMTSVVDLRLKATYGATLTDHLMTGGYVFSAETGDFHPLNLLSGWVDLDGHGTVAPGLFAGYLTNQGSADPVGEDVTEATRAPDIDVLWRVAPRLTLNYDALQFAFELEVTSAQYAERLDADFAPAGSTEAVTNVRGNVTVFLHF